jgi:asparagine synthase (glutamine-hydrolysing)
MCGIFGVINTKEKIDEGRVLAARDVLAHRGPDDSGLYLSCTHASIHPNVALAHRRLSIIDLSPEAHQPMGSGRAHGAERIAIRTQILEQSAERTETLNTDHYAPRYEIVFNGEIYNYKSLLPSPPPKGEGAFKSNSDTEILLYLYTQYGKDCLNMLRGMFAFAIWDEKEKTLFAARDRFGIKPFYYLKNDDEFIFSSELKAIKQYKNNLTIANDGIDAYLRTGSIPAPLTIYNEVFSLLPGNYLTIKNEQLTINNYWKFGDLIVKDAKKNVQSSKLSPPQADQYSINEVLFTSKLSIEHSKFNINQVHWARL